MANILEFLRGVLTDAEVREAFVADPTGFLERTGFGDLTGEDVAEAIAVVRRSLPEQTAAALAAFEDEDDLSGVRPQAGERELDAAARVLRYAVEQVPLDRRPARAQPPGPARAADRPERSGRPAPERRAPAPTARPVDVELPPLPSITGFADTMSALVSETKSRLTEVLRQAAVDAEQLRADAEAEVVKLRTEASTDREAAREYLERTRVESDAVLQRSNETLEDARRQRDELLQASHAETEAARREISARRAELRDAERQLRERLSGIDALFRTVLRDEDDPAPTGDGPADQ